MITKVQSNPEAIHVATDYIKLGKSVELNRQRVTNVVYSINQANTEARLKQLDDISSDKKITDSEKVSLKRELETLIRDYDYLSNDAKNADLLETQTYRDVLESYNRLVELMDKIVNSVGTYEGDDVLYLSTYYSDYTEKATALETLISDTTAEVDKIANYYAKTKIDVNVYPEAVPVNTTTDVRLSVLYEGEEKVQLVALSAITFGLTGLADVVTQQTVSNYVTLPSGASITVTALTHSAIITNCNRFELAYGALGETGVSINAEVSLDSDNMPF